MQKSWVSALVLVLFVFIGYYIFRKYKVAPTIRFETMELTTLDGRDTLLAGVNGRKTLICFAASWCKPCRQELRDLAGIDYKILEDIDVVVISDETPGKIMAFRGYADAGFYWLRLKEPFST